MNTCVTFISSHEVKKLYISFVASPLMKYIFFSLHSMKCHIHDKKLHILYYFIQTAFSVLYQETMVRYMSYRRCFLPGDHSKIYVIQTAFSVLYQGTIVGYDTAYPDGVVFRPGGYNRIYVIQTAFSVLYQGTIVRYDTSYPDGVVCFRSGDHIKQWYLTSRRCYLFQTRRP